MLGASACPDIENRGSEISTRYVLFVRFKVKATAFLGA